MGGRFAPQGWQVENSIDRSIGCSTDAQAVRPYLSWNELSHTPTLNDFHRDVHAPSSIDEQRSGRIEASGLATWSLQRSQRSASYHERLPMVRGFSEHHEGQFPRRIPIAKEQTTSSWERQPRSDAEFASSCLDRRDHEQPVHSHIYTPEARMYQPQAAAGLSLPPLEAISQPHPHFSAQPYFPARPDSHPQSPENAQQTPFQFLPPELFMPAGSTSAPRSWNSTPSIASSSEPDRLSSEPDRLSSEPFEVAGLARDGSGRSPAKVVSYQDRVRQQRAALQRVVKSLANSIGCDDIRPQAVAGHVLSLWNAGDKNGDLSSRARSMLTLPDPRPKDQSSYLARPIPTSSQLARPSHEEKRRAQKSDYKVRRRLAELASVELLGTLSGLIGRERTARRSGVDDLSAQKEAITNAFCDTLRLHRAEWQLLLDAERRTRMSSGDQDSSPLAMLLAYLNLTATTCRTRPYQTFPM